MTYFQRLIGAIGLNKKALFRTVSILSVAALVMANIAPEISATLPSNADDTVMAQAPTQYPDSQYFYVDRDGIQVDGGSACTLHAARTAYPTSPAGTCSINDAIYAANSQGGKLTIVIADSIPTIHLTNNLLALYRTDGSELIIDGAKSGDGSTKTIMQDSTTDGNTLDYFFHIGPLTTNLAASLIPQSITIKNFSFVTLKKATAAAITTNKPASSFLDGTQINRLEIANNYFGTTDGETLDPKNVITEGIQVFLESVNGTTPELAPSRLFRINNNNFYNVIFPIQIGTANDTSYCASYNTETQLLPIKIDGNHIGVATDDSVNTHINGEGAWSLAAINVCNLNNVVIQDNNIFNSFGLFIDTAINLINSQFSIESNHIGGINTATGTDSNLAKAIFGYGIRVHGNYLANSSSIPESYIRANEISNIFTPIITETISAFCTGRYAISAAGKSCGGTAILIENSVKNLIYGNSIGSPNFPNQGYGIELEGEASSHTETQSPLDVYLQSSDNKIFHNIIGYNKADGIHIGNISNNIGGSSLDNLACVSTSVISTTTNNCFNSILQNTIFRNGAYNADSFGSIDSNEGGIGIDLRGTSETSEQKYGATFLTGTGTTNDTDISINDSGDSDNGGNGVINTPVIDGSGSTAYEITGQLPDNNLGKYWVEVYSVICPTTGLSTPLITSANAHANCDTDSVSSAAQDDGETFGQGFNFLCGTLVNKTITTDSDTWSCKPSDFGTSFSKGLITATITSLPSSITKVPYSTGSSTFPPAFSSHGSTAGFSCEIAKEFLNGSTIDTLCPSSGNLKAIVDLHGNEYYIIRGLQNTSEFSQNLYIAAAPAAISKTVRTCTSISSCLGDFGSSVTTTPGSLVEYRIDIENTTDSAIHPTIVDDLLSGLSFEAETCQFFVDQATVSNTRPSSGAHDCSSNISGQTLSITTTTDTEVDNHAVVYFLVRIDSNAVVNNYLNTATAEISGVCGDTADNTCESSANVLVQRNQNITVRKEIISPDTDSPANTSRESIVSGPQTQVNYRITTTFQGVDRGDVGNYGLEDNFPKIIRTGGTPISYSNCTYSIQIDGVAQPGTFPCDNIPDITNRTDPVIIWNGANFPVSATPNNRVVVTINYQSTIPANALIAGSAAVNIDNQARWIHGTTETESARTSTTRLIINAPTAQSTPSITMSKGVTPATITSSSSTQNVTYSIHLQKSADAITNISWTDTFPTTPVALTYSNCQVVVVPAGSSVIPCPSPFNGSGTSLTTATSINAATTDVTITYTATVPANAVTTTQTITNRSTFTGTANGTALNSGEKSAILTIFSAQSGGNSGTGANPTITKRADNNVTNNDHKREKVFKPGDTINYTVSMVNTGSVQALNATVTDTLPTNLSAPVIDSTPTGTTASISGQTITLPAFTIPTGVTGLSLSYHSVLNDRNNIDLSDFNMDADSRPDRDQDFYVSDDASLDDSSVSSTNNNHRRTNAVIGKPDGKFVSLGKNGQITIDLGTKVIVDGTGNDFAILQLNRASDDTDQATESYTVSVSQDNDNFTDISTNNTDSDGFDIKKAHMTWVRYIKIEDTSSKVSPNAPGVDIDAVCLLNIGVQMPNNASLNYNGQTVSASVSAVVDITKVFKHKPDAENCTEAQPEVKPAPAPQSPPPTVQYQPAQPAPAPKPPILPKSGPELLGLLGLAATATVIFRRFRK